jgi:hypothetical protein
MLAAVFIGSAASTLATNVRVNQPEGDEASDIQTRQFTDLSGGIPLRSTEGIYDLLPGTNFEVNLVSPPITGGIVPPGTYDVTLDIHYNDPTAGPGAVCCIEPKHILAEIWTTEQNPPEELCCYDMESSWDIYNNMETTDVDLIPDPNGALDTWAPSYVRSNSPDHSFHCTQFDTYSGSTYFGNANDWLAVYCTDPAIVSQDPDTIRVEYARWVEGEEQDLGFGYSSAVDYLDTYLLVQWAGSWWFFTSGFAYNPAAGLGIPDIESLVTGPSSWNTISADFAGMSGLGFTGYGIAFQWTSNPTCQFEGAYIDDVCFYSVESPDVNKIWQGYNQEMECFSWCEPREFTFPLPVTLVDGECYTLHAQLHPDLCGGPDEVFEWDFCVGSCPDILVNCPTINSPICYEDLEIDVDVENYGNEDMTNIPIEASLYRMDHQILIDDEVETGGDMNFVNFGGFTGDQIFHVTDKYFESPYHSYYWGVEDPTCPGGYDDYTDDTLNGLFTPTLDLTGAVGGDCIDGADLTFDIKWNLNSQAAPMGIWGMDFWCYGVVFPDDNIYRLLGPITAGTNGGWTTMSFADALGAYGYRFDSDCDGTEDMPIDDLVDLCIWGQGRGYTNGFKCSVGIFCHGDPAYTEADDLAPAAWGGVQVDNIFADAYYPTNQIWSDNIVIPSLNIGQTVNLDFIKDYMTVGKYYIKVEHTNTDCRPCNNIGDAIYFLGTEIESAHMSEFVIEDLTSVGTCCFHPESSGYDNYFTCIDCTTGAYANNINVALQYKYPMNFLGLASVNLDIVEWYDFDWLAFTWGWGPGDFVQLEFCNDVSSAFPHWDVIDNFDSLVGEWTDSRLDYWDGDGVNSGWVWHPRNLVITPASFTPLMPFTADMGFRIRFTTDSKFTGIGYQTDSIHLYDPIAPTDFILEECDDMDDWICDALTAGSLWHMDPLSTPDDPQYNWFDMMYPTWYYPNMNDALTWVTEINQAFNTVLKFEADWMLIGTLTTDADIVWLELSEDGTNWDMIHHFEGISGGFTSFEYPLYQYGTGTLFVRFRATSDAATTGAAPDGTAGDSGGFIVKDLEVVGFVDLAAPVSRCSISGTLADGWYSSDVTVTLTADDDVSGIANIFYILDGGTPQTYTGPIKVTTNGPHTVEYWAEDKVGNVESPHNFCPAFKIDKGTPPTVEITAPTPGLYLMGTQIPLGFLDKPIIIGGFNIEANANDADSGVYQVSFYLNDQLIGADTASPYNMYCAIKNMGAATIKVVAEDFTGNSAEDTLDVTYYKFF